MNYERTYTMTVYRRWMGILFLAWLLPFGMRAAVNEDHKLIDGLHDRLREIGYASLPLRRTEDNRLYVEAKVNGRRLHLLVDTGWETSALDENLAESLSKAGEGGFPESDPVLGALTNRAMIVLQRLELGTVSLSNQPMRPLKHLRGGGSRRPEGVLGLDFLARQQCLVECARGTLYIRTNNPVRGDLPPLDLSAATRGIYFAPLQSSRDGLVLQASVNGNPVRLVVDSGAWTTLLDEETAEGLNLHGERTRVHSEGATRRYAVAQRIAVRSLGLGLFQIHDTTIGTINLDKMLPKPRERPLPSNGILGMEHMMWNLGLIDVVGRRLYLAPTRPRSQ